MSALRHERSRRRFSNSRVCLQVFPSLPSPLPLPLPLFLLFSSRPIFARPKDRKSRSLVFLCPPTARKHLLHRLVRGCLLNIRKFQSKMWIVIQFCRNQPENFWNKLNVLGGSPRSRIETSERKMWLQFAILRRFYPSWNYYHLEFIPGYLGKLGVGNISSKYSLSGENIARYNKLRRLAMPSNTKDGIYPFQMWTSAP